MGPAWLGQGRSRETLGCNAGPALPWADLQLSPIGSRRPALIGHCHYVRSVSAAEASGGLMAGESLSTALPASLPLRGHPGGLKSLFLLKFGSYDPMSAFLPDTHSSKEPLLTLFTVRTCTGPSIIILIIVILSIFMRLIVFTLITSVVTDRGLCVRNPTPRADQCLAFVTVIVLFSLECG